MPSINSMTFCTGVTAVCSRADTATLRPKIKAERTHFIAMQSDEASAANLCATEFDLDPKRLE
eukprot:CAMPEP_0176055462 /NCGR_PEP_ID=MMETSP0120_2-20121206/27612_1 /TAXON_ID=160619 /ORGANISM="Kryptoperidinium foliaceum, Strain CCMP 1326" /LENGTH=62 /DNA_ID=CAMNT_0017388957 /DNA_START=50 /DNA_END=235 /DNA_ORIENTATION=-